VAHGNLPGFGASCENFIRGPVYFTAVNAVPPSFFSAPQRHRGRIWREWDGALRLKFGPTRRSALQVLFAGIRVIRGPLLISNRPSRGGRLEEHGGVVEGVAEGEAVGVETHWGIGGAEGLVGAECAVY